MDELAYVRVMEEVLPFLPPYEQVVYHRLFFLTQAQGHAQISIRYEDLARQCRLSLPAIRRAIKALIARTLLQTSWQPKSATTFVVLITPQTPWPRRSPLRAASGAARAPRWAPPALRPNLGHLARQLDLRGYPLPLGIRDLGVYPSRFDRPVPQVILHVL